MPWSNRKKIKQQSQRWSKPERSGPIRSRRPELTRGIFEVERLAPGVSLSTRCDGRGRTWPLFWGLSAMPSNPFGLKQGELPNKTPHSLRIWDSQWCWVIGLRSSEASRSFPTNEQWSVLYVGSHWSLLVMHGGMCMVLMRHKVN